MATTANTTNWTEHLLELMTKGSAVGEGSIAATQMYQYLEREAPSHVAATAR